MATVTYEEALQDDLLVLKDKFLLVDTIEDGYTKTYLGNHPYRVTQSEAGDYAIYPVFMKADSTLVNEKYPIIQTDGEVIFFTVGSTIDPYNFTRFEKVDLNGKNKEQQVLLAFEAFIMEEYRLGIHNVFLTDTPFIADDAVPFEFTTEFERDLIHPNSGE